MGQPAAVMGDEIRGTCLIHQSPNEASGIPEPAGPLPFSAALSTGLAATVFIGGKPAAVQGSSGVNMPPHIGLHLTDPFAVPPMQRGQVVAGSPTVFIEGRQAARSGSPVRCCAEPGQITGSAVTVLIA